MPRLEKWGIIPAANYSPYTVPELIQGNLYGKVYDHARFDDGVTVTTSTVIGKRGNMVCTRSGSEYILGEPHPEYEEQFPGVRNRVLNQLKDMED